MEKRKWFSTEKLTLLALLVALQVVLGNVLQIPMLGKQYNVGFLPAAAAGALLGIPGGVVVCALGDVIGAHLFPTGPYFPGFTLTSALVGVLYGFFLYRRQPSWIRVILTVACSALINLFLNSYWLSLLYASKAYWGWVAARAPSYLVEAPAHIVLIFLTLKGLGRVPLPASLRLPEKEEKE